MSIMKNKKIVVLVLILFTALAAGSVYGWMRYTAEQNEQAAINNPSTDNIVEDKDQSLTDGQSSGEDKVIAPTPSSPSDTAPEKPTITRAEVSGDYIRISATFTQPSSGECVAVLEKSGATTVTKTASIIVGPSYYTCNGFRIPRSELSQSGTWVVSVIHRANNQESTSEKRNIEVQ